MCFAVLTMPPTNQHFLIRAIKAAADAAGVAATAALADRHNWKSGQALAVLKKHGVAYTPGRWLGQPLTGSQSASLSRTLRQLRERGLVIASSLCGEANRATYVKLTPAGEALARELLEQPTHA